MTIQTDPILEKALNKAKAKYLAGVKEHGGSLADADIDVLELLRMQQEEQIDQLFYTEAAIQALENMK